MPSCIVAFNRRKTFYVLFHSCYVFGACFISGRVLPAVVITYEHTCITPIIKRSLLMSKVFKKNFYFYFSRRNTARFYDLSSLPIFLPRPFSIYVKKVKREIEESHSDPGSRPGSSSPHSTVIFSELISAPCVIDGLRLPRSCHPSFSRVYIFLNTCALPFSVIFFHVEGVDFRLLEPLSRSSSALSH